MSTVTLELEAALSQLDNQSAALLEQLVRDALALVRRNNEPANNGKAAQWPAGYFETTAGSFANEPLDAPADPPPTPKPEW